MNTPHEFRRVARSKVGYRGAANSFEIDSNQFQFNFGRLDERMLCPLPLDPNSSLGCIERVKVYLEDGRCLHHLFLVNRKYVYYFDHARRIESERDMFSHLPPEANAYDQFGFSNSSIRLIQLDNKVKLFWRDWYVFLSIEYFWLSVPKLADGPVSLEYNLECFVTQWKQLPPHSQRDLFRL